jgi:predicted CXXCH cytochrome family protein
MEKARRGLQRVPLKNGTLHHPVEGKHGASTVMLAPAAEGAGVKAGGPMRAVFDVMGVRNIVAKSHGSTNPYNLVRATLNDTCYECHAEKRGPLLWEHQPVTEDCSTCHAAHGSSNPGMVKLRGPLLCQSCHSQQGHPSLGYGPSGLPGNAAPATALALGNCMNCHSQVHGSNHPSGSSLTR